MDDVAGKISIQMIMRLLKMEILSQEIKLTLITKSANKPQSNDFD